MQVEEAYTSAEHLCKRMGIESGPVLRFEVPLLQGLGFDLVVHSPYRALAGLFKVSRAAAQGAQGARWPAAPAAAARACCGCCAQSADRYTALLRPTRAFATLPPRLLPRLRRAAGV